MLGLFGALDMGSRSLAAQQLSMEVAGQNLANVNNPAYARQKVTIQTSTPLDTPLGEEGTGVNATSIVQLRNTILDSQITSESSTTGSLNAQQTALEDAEANLGEQISGTSGTTSTSANGLAQGMSTFFNDFQALTSDPSSLTQRGVLLQDAQQLASQFNQVSTGLNNVRSGLNTSIQNDVTSANQDLTDIANLNKQITLYQASTGQTANDLIDSRQAKLEDLAGKINFTATPQTNGGVNITIGGVTMVSGATTPDSLQAYDAGGGQFLVRAATAGTPLTLTGGSIQGNIDVRDGALADLQSNVNTLANQLITQVNTIHASGYDLNGNTGQKFFTGTDAATISVNTNLLGDPSQLQASGTGAAGDNKVALALAQLANSSIVGLNGQTFSSSYASTVANLGQAAASVNNQVTNQSAVTSMLSTQRDSVSGVSIDEEMTNMLQFQKAYEASAKLISTINAMLETVIAMKAS